LRGFLFLRPRPVAECAVPHVGLEPPGPARGGRRLRAATEDRAQEQDVRGLHALREERLDELEDRGGLPGVARTADHLDERRALPQSLAGRAGLPPAEGRGRTSCGGRVQAAEQRGQLLVQAPPRPLSCGQVQHCSVICACYCVHHNAHCGPAA